MQGKSNEIEQLGKNVAALIRIADPPFSKIGSTQVPLLAAKHHVTDADPGLPAHVVPEVPTRGAAGNDGLAQAGRSRLGEPRPWEIRFAMCGKENPLRRLQVLARLLRRCVCPLALDAQFRLEAFAVAVDSGHDQGFSGGQVVDVRVQSINGAVHARLVPTRGVTHVPQSHVVALAPVEGHMGMSSLAAGTFLSEPQKC